MSTDVKRDKRDSSKPPILKAEEEPNYSLWQGGVTERRWSDAAVAFVLYRSGLEIIGVGAVIALGIIGTSFIRNRSSLDTRELLGSFIVAAMLFGICVLSLIKIARSYHAENAEQVKRGSAESGNRRGRSQENGGAQRRNGIAQPDGRGQ